MPLLIKPRTLGCLTRIERRPSGASLILSAFAMFDLAAPDRDRLQSEQALWLMIAEELTPPAVFDIGMPKPTAELLLAGHAAAPGGEPVERMGLACAFGDIRKEFLITGDRYWKLEGASAVATEPVPFSRMPLTPARSFGGPSHPLNPAGQGHRAPERLAGGEAVALPNIEVPARALRSVGEEPPPATFGPLAVDAPERLRHAGTYDAAWMKTLAPGLAADADPRLFLFASPDQRLPDYLNGDEGFGLLNFAADAPDIRQHLPGFRVRGFIGWADAEKPLTEVSMRIDTLWFFAGARRGVLVHRGVITVGDIEGADVADIMFAYERMGDAPRPFEHYLEVRRLRTDPATAFKYALAEHQLTPTASPDAIAARHAKRAAAANERSRRRREDMAWVTERELLRAEVPKELWPAMEMPEEEPGDLQLPLPEEIESGDVDLAALLDAIDAQSLAQERKLATIVEQQQPVLDAMQKIASGTAEPGAIDQLLALLDQPEIAMQLDAEIDRLPPAAALPLAEGEASEASAALDKAREWRGAFLDAAHGAVDEDAQFIEARARFLDLPEGRPFARVREQLTPERLGLPDLPELRISSGATGEEEAAPADLTEALLALDHSPHAPPGAATRLADAVAETEGRLSALMPGLAATGKAPLAALAELAGPGDPTPSRPDEALDAARGKLARSGADLHDELDAAEARLTAGLAELRRSAQQPLKPDRPLAPAVARRLGELAVEQARAGLALAGRDLAGADLSGLDLSGVDLSGAFLECANLDNATLCGANLTKATLCGASLAGTDLSRCDLGGANFSAAHGAAASFAGSRLVDMLIFEADLPDAILERAEIRDVQFIRSGLTRARLTAARIEGLMLLQSEASGSDWSGAEVQRSQIVETPLKDAMFTKCRLFETAFLRIQGDGCQFAGATLQRVAFTGDIELRAADFREVSADGLSFVKANLGGSDFSSGTFSGLCFVDTELERCRFRTSAMRRALFSRNSLAHSDFFAADLLEAQFNRADLSGASLRHANLFGADLMDADLLGADFSRANLARTLFAVASDVD